MLMRTSSSVNQMADQTCYSQSDRWKGEQSNYAAASFRGSVVNTIARRALRVGKPPETAWCFDSH
jgi:hypothetical protein